MKPPQAQQQVRHYLYDSSGAIVTGGSPQLVLAQSQSRCYLTLQNLSSGPLVFDFGSARATCTVTNGTVTAVTITNAGFNFTKPPVVRFEGGGNANNSSYLGLNQPSGPSPSRPAKAHCVLAGGAVSSIVIDDPGAGYATAPYVLIVNTGLDPYGCALPAVTPTAGNLLLPGGSEPFKLDAAACPTDSIGVIGATTGQAYSCRWMD